MVLIICQTKIYVYTDDIELISSFYQQLNCYRLQFGLSALPNPPEVTSKISVCPNNCNIILSNHRTRVDWMYVGWSYVTLFGAASTFKIILKNGLKSVPLYGWGMQALQFIFLTRERAKDLPHIIQSVRYILYASAKASPVSVPVDIGIPPMSILIFPEGTDLHEKAIAQSNEFLLQQWRKQNPSAQPKDGMEDSNSVAPPSRKHTLCPKVAGATAIIKTCLDYYALSQLKFDSLLDANVDARRNHILLHDVTVAYRDFTPGVRTSDISLVKG